MDRERSMTLPLPILLQVVGVVLHVLAVVVVAVVRQLETMYQSLKRKPESSRFLCASSPTALSSPAAQVNYIRDEFRHVYDNITSQ